MSTSTPTPHDIVLRLNTIEQLFNAPQVNPFSDKEIDVLGESALTRITRRLLRRPMRNWEGTRMIIQIPADKITPDLQQKTYDAVSRYTNAKIEDHTLTIRLSRTLGLVALLMAIGISVGALALTSFLLTGPLANVSETVRGWIIAFVAIFAWVALWDPLSKLLFEWVGPWLQIRVLRRIGAMPIVIEPQDERGNE